MKSSHDLTCGEIPAEAFLVLLVQKTMGYAEGPAPGCMWLDACWALGSCPGCRCLLGDNMTPASVWSNLELFPHCVPEARPAPLSRWVCASVLRLQPGDRHHPQVRYPGAEVTQKQLLAFALEHAPLPPAQCPATVSTPTCPGDTITGCGWEHPGARHCFPGHPDHLPSFPLT